MKAVVAALNQEKALVGAFSVITNLRMELFEALLGSRRTSVSSDLSCYFIATKFVRSLPAQNVIIFLQFPTRD